jgi:hypothetical protein
VWEPLIAIADRAGGPWPAWSRQAAATIEAERRAGDVSLGIRLLADIHTVAGQLDKIGTVDLLDRLNGLEEAPWGNLRGKPLDDRGLARRLKKYGPQPKPIRVGPVVSKGYDLADFADPWSRYLSLAHGSVTSVTADTAEPGTPAPDLSLFVTDVTDVTDPMERDT